jgi:hypothetical protein
LREDLEISRSIGRGLVPEVDSAINSEVKLRRAALHSSVGDPNKADYACFVRFLKGGMREEKS